MISKGDKLLSNIFKSMNKFCLADHYFSLIFDSIIYNLGNLINLINRDFHFYGQNWIIDIINMIGFQEIYFFMMNKSIMW